ncbi:MAG: PepSY domain-containing protein [Aphanocapsa sp. GSE-SYN-MK-11-07L]|jgi:uncharacterized iron-regulated membrane protein|nr:PepSY domain-containing protein [Aphanocapsa sp. GSE-SYN-MK-11-07L]
MNLKKLRKLIFSLHRYLGLALGLIIVVIGLTGSLLIFKQTSNQFQVEQQFGKITPQEQTISLATAVETVQAAYAEQSAFKISDVESTLPELYPPYYVRLEKPDHKMLEVLVNPYTGAIIGTRENGDKIGQFVVDLHSRLLAGKFGYALVGIIACLMVILSITGVLLWPGWRNLLAGFKIKWNAHPKRLNFDIHKVAGIVTGLFLILLAITGINWNLSDFSNAIVYSLTFTSQPPTVASILLPDKQPLSPGDLLRKAEAVLPDAQITYVIFPHNIPQDTLNVRKKYPQEPGQYGSSWIELDQYTGKVLRVIDGRQSAGATWWAYGGAEILHYGTFWGLPTRILYFFVGLAPLTLFITGFVMWQHRRKP